MSFKSKALDSVIGGAMPWPVAVIGVFAILAGFVFYGWLALRLYRRFRITLQQRGYKSPAVLVGLGALAYAGPLVITVLSFDYGDDAALWWLMGMMLAAPLALTLVARLLPLRRVRTTGKRVVRFPYRRTGQGLLGAAGVLWTIAGVTNQSGWFQTGTVCAMGGFGALAIARRAAAPDAAAVLAADTRPPVIYLRPFQQEESPFAELPWRWRDFFANVKRTLVTAKSRHMTFEQFVGEQISKRLGPFIALGNPVDFVPPEGAARTYVADEEWERYFETMARRARCIVVMAASSEHVQWELTRIRALELAPKLFVLTRPRLSPKTKIGGWDTFVAGLRQAGYRPCADDPGPGAVVTFAADGEAVVCQRDATTAPQIVDALCRRLELTAGEARRPGR
jgi:hypothetical protein